MPSVTDQLTETPHGISEVERDQISEKIDEGIDMKLEIPSDIDDVIKYVSRDVSVLEGPLEVFLQRIADTSFVAATLFSGWHYSDSSVHVLIGVMVDRKRSKQEYDDPGFYPYSQILKDYHYFESCMEKYQDQLTHAIAFLGTGGRSGSELDSWIRGQLPDDPAYCTGKDLEIFAFAKTTPYSN